ncbi:MAG: hypothetical protein V1659_02220 [Candidatus Woesearchaeota archaeon]
MLPSIIAKTIAFDIDDVLLNWLDSFIAFHNKFYGTRLTRGDFKRYSVADTLKVGLREEFARILKFEATDYFRQMPALEGAAEGLAELRQYLDSSRRFISVTSRSKGTESITKRLIELYFPGMFLNKDIFIAGCARNSGKDGFRPKSGICLENNVGIVVEDSLANAIELTCTGIHVVLFRHPTNQYEFRHPLIHRAESWPEIVDRVKMLAD